MDEVLAQPGALDDGTARAIDFEPAESASVASGVLHERNGGIAAVHVRGFLLAALAVWAADERVRAGALGLPWARSTQYRDLLLDVGPELA